MNPVDSATEVLLAVLVELITEVAGLTGMDSARVRVLAFLDKLADDLVCGNAIAELVATNKNEMTNMFFTEPPLGTRKENSNCGALVKKNNWN